MPWKTIDFHGVANLDRSLLEQLRAYLETKESTIGYSILHIVKNCIEDDLLSGPPQVPMGHVRIAESIEACERRVNEALESSRLLPSEEKWQTAVIDKVNVLLWDYVETLEGSVTELFQQLGQVPLEQWDGDLFQVVGAIRDLLMQHIEEASWAIHRLDEIFWNYLKGLERKKHPLVVLLKGMIFYWQMLLDRALLTNLDKSRKFFSFHYRKFSARYREYLKLKVRGEQSTRKLERYHVLSLLESDNQKTFQKSYQLLKIWSINQTQKVLPKELLDRTVQNAVHFKRVLACFYEYHLMLRRILFERSRILKRDAHEEFMSPENISHQQRLITGYRAEVHTLWSTISRYREFLLSTDPDPYIRSRWGFSEWTVGPEPAQTKQLLDLEYDLEFLDHNFESIHDALAKGPEHQIAVSEMRVSVNMMLHEMSQPLISKSMMRANSENLLQALQKLNELGSFDYEAVDFVGETLTKALRLDWKYHVLFDLPLFSQIYMIHQGIVGESTVRPHLNRTNHFKELIAQLRSWVQTHTLNKHAHEIEQDINDIKEGLQDFFAYVQRNFNSEGLTREKALEKIKEVSQVLLEYRYLFGSFFHDLKEQEPQERIIRKKFLFIDQYFDSVDGKIHEFRKFLLL